MKTPEFRKLERVRALVRAVCAASFAFALFAAAAPEGQESATPSPEVTPGIAPLDAHGNIVTPPPAATAPTIAPIATPWIQPPPHSRTPMPFTPAMVGGFALILLGISFFWAEAHATSHGTLAAAGVLCVLAGLAFIFGYTMLAITLSWSAIGPLVLIALGLMAWTVYKGIKSMDETPMGDLQEHLGKIVRAAGPLKPEGKVDFDGAFWNAVSTKPVPDGAKVRIIGAQGLTLRVEPAE